ncbi:MAG TPA: serine/threonine-protein kinase [Phycisphaerae bacterium]|nr:serine/threonine-protein kinase [Phycisphaerae bacterium]HRW54669.1 serine/threonine-protein kinase [Phycisphaerae bacterium]
MDASGRHEREMEIFERVCDLPPEQRDRALNDLCEGDASLRQRIETMLALDNTDDRRLDNVDSQTRMAQLIESVTDATSEENIPERIAGYRIIRKVGAGGMGVIFEAEQESPRRRVALKVLRPGLFGREALKRFQHEAQVLGHLQHAGIAQIHEAGMAAGGNGSRQPFFAMELVDGEPLDQFCNTRKLGARQRLELIARVCDAVQHAHQKGVVHRDLKPNNVLVVASESTSSVGLHDPLGQPKVLDFGVARVTDADVQTVTVQTEVGQLVGTLAYMSPEQVAGNSEDIDTRSDVYALGVMLFETLSDRRPHDFAGLSIVEAARIIAETDPPPLGQLDRALRGDVETIAAKALEKDRERRYGSAAELAADIRRHLQYQPIEARPAGTAYHLSRFARRNRGLVAGFMTAVAALTIGLFASGYYLLEARTQRNKAVEASRAAKRDRNDAIKARDSAVLAREEADQVISFQAAQLADINPPIMGQQLRQDLLAALPDDERRAVEESLGRVNFTNLALATLQKSIFERSLNAIVEHFDSDPPVEARLLITLGETAQKIGLLDVAEPPLRKALAIREDVLGADHIDTLTAQSLLGGLLIDQGRVKEATPLVHSAFDRGVTAHGEDPPNWDTWADNLIKLLFERRQFAEAESLQRKRIDRLLQGRPLNETALLTARETLAGILLQRHDPEVLDEAESLLSGAYETRLDKLGPNHPRTLWTQATLAVLLRKRGRIDEALPLTESLWRARQEVLGTDHPETLSTGNNLASLYYRAGRREDAVAMLQRIVESRRRVLGEEHLDYIISLENLGTVQDALGHTEASHRLFSDALSLRRRVFGSDNPETLLSCKHMGDLSMKWGKVDAALPLYIETLAGAIAYFGPEHDNTLSVLEALLTAAGLDADVDDPSAEYQAAVKVAEGRMGADHQHTLAILGGYARFLIHKENWKDAHEILTDLQQRQDRLPSTDAAARRETERLLAETQAHLHPSARSSTQTTD